MPLKSYLALPVILFVLVPQLSAGEWGAEAAIGANPTAYYQEELQKQNSNFRSKITGRRHALSFTAKLHYEWIGIRLSSDNYIAGSGKQKLDYNVPGPGNSSSRQSIENEGVDYAAARSFRGELQLRRFYYGHREIFTLNSGLLFRSVTTDLTGQPADYLPQSVSTRYLTAGISIDPLLTHFGNIELSLPIDASIGFKFPEGGLFDGGGPGAVLLAAGLRLGFEPRGAFATAQGVLNFYDTPYSAAGAKYSFSQLDVALRLMVGYYFRNPVYHE